MSTSHVRSGPARSRPVGQRRRIRRTAAGFVAPFFVLFTVFYLVPIGYAVWQSFQKIERTSGIYGPAHTKFAGLSQYTRIVSGQEFWGGVERMGLFGLVQVPVMVAVALGLALLLDSGLPRGMKFFRGAYFVPFAVPAVIGALMWGYLYSPGVSPVLSGLAQAGMHPEPLSGGLILWSIANVVTWTYTGYNMLIIYSSLKSISPEIYEAARMDGAGTLRIAWSLKIPLVRPSIVMTTVFSIIGTLQLYAEPTMLKIISTAIASDYTPNMQAFAAAAGNDYSGAAAISVLLAVVTFAMSFGFLRFTARRQERT
ncbi:carbohydrate ABC transporter permease [Longispora fulva]|nr:sugar ABC transporter permease [Longispora fulva]